MSSIMRARSALTDRWGGWEVIGGASRAEGCWTLNARDRMPRPSRLTADYPVENARTMTRAPSRESGFVLAPEAVILSPNCAIYRLLPRTVTKHRCSARILGV